MSSDGIKTGVCPCPGKSMAETYVLAIMCFQLMHQRCPVYRRRESYPGFRMELENLVGDGKGKDARGRTPRSKVPRRQPGADCSVVVRKQGNACGAKGAGHPHRDR